MKFGDEKRSNIKIKPTKQHKCHKNINNYQRIKFCKKNTSENRLPEVT